jgi:hypothetical protein
MIEHLANDHGEITTAMLWVSENWPFLRSYFSAPWRRRG